jgi:hypothetical protein
MKSRKLWMRLSLIAMSIIAALSISGQSSIPAPPTMLRIQIGEPPFMPVQPTAPSFIPPPPAPTKPHPVIPDPVVPNLASSGTAQSGSLIQPGQTVKSGTNGPLMFTNQPAGFTNRSPVSTNYMFKFTPTVFFNQRTNHENSWLGHSWSSPTN